MDCQYINQNEIYEKYLLGRLGDAEKKEYEAHLQGCETCRKTLETQREMIAAIRLKAKQDMKREIQLQAGKLREQRPKQDWTVWYKAAAVILLFSVVPALLYYYLHTGTIPLQKKTIPAAEHIEEQQEALPPA
ncbi:MAG TPA: hypothetical protein ENK44_08060, partial [Caldithrix abyssi]|nr:hypothetical protein [Caldithrix abyssi]